jgi:hypothetical protein
MSHKSKEEAIKAFARELGHAYNNEIFKINAFIEIFEANRNDQEKINNYIKILKRTIENINGYTAKLSHFAYSGEIPSSEQ